MKCPPNRVNFITTIADVLVPANDRTYAYVDHQYFLTQGNGPWGNLSWTYDTIGNRLTETRGMTTDAYAYVPNVAGGNSPTLMSTALGAGGSEAFMFDPAGNQTQIASPSTTLDSTFDNASRQASTGDSIFTVANRYDGRGFLERSERTYPGALFVDGFESGDFACWSDVDGGPVGGTCPAGPPFVAPTYSSDGMLHYLLRGFGDDQRWVLYHAGRPVALVKEVGGGGTEVTFLTTDHLGTPVLAMDSVGGEVWEGGFEPFGADFSDAGGAGVLLRFPGQWDDSLWGGVGDSYNVHRWYQSGTGRYGRADPMGLVNPNTFSPTSPHGSRIEMLYGYTEMNPLLRVDTLALRSRVCCRLIAGGFLGRARHCFFQVERNGRKTTCGLVGGKFSGQPENTGYILSDNSFDKVKNPEKACGPWSEDCATDDCVIQRARSYANPSFYRFARGPNSNSFAGNIARACGLKRPDVGSTPGWNNAPAPPRFIGPQAPRKPVDCDLP